MHETGIVYEIIEAVKREAAQHFLNKVNRVKLRIGESAYHSKDSLVFVFEGLSKDSPLEGAELIIEDGEGRGIEILEIEGN